MKQKVLLVSRAFYPELSPRSFRASELAKEFIRQGYDVTVISKFRDYDYSGFLKKFPVKLKMWSKPSFPAVPQFRRKPFSVLSRSLSRFLSLLFEYPDIEEMYQVEKMLKNEQGYDLMISFAVPFPVHWGVARARKKNHPIARKWIADCGDPYMLGRMDTFKKPFYFKYPEINFCRKCDYISVPFQEMKKQFYPEFLEKIKVIPQGISFTNIKLFEGPVKNRKPIFIFAGSVIPGKRDLTLFLEFLSKIPNDFLFIVYTNQDFLFEKHKKILGNKLELKSYIERSALIYEMSKASFLVNVDSVFDNEKNKEAVPSKLIDYSLSSRPILNINSGNLNEELVMQFLNGNYSGRRKIDISNYDIRNVTRKFIVLEDLKMKNSITKSLY